MKDDHLHIDGVYALKEASNDLISITDAYTGGRIPDKQDIINILTLAEKGIADIKKANDIKATDMKTGKAKYTLGVVSKKG